MLSRVSQIEGMDRTRTHYLSSAKSGSTGFEYGVRAQ